MIKISLYRVLAVLVIALTLSYAIAFLLCDAAMGCSEDRLLVSEFAGAMLAVFYAFLGFAFVGVSILTMDETIGGTWSHVRPLFRWLVRFNPSVTIPTPRRKNKIPKAKVIR